MVFRDIAAKNGYSCCAMSIKTSGLCVDNIGVARSPSGDTALDELVVSPVRKATAPEPYGTRC